MNGNLEKAVPEQRPEGGIPEQKPEIGTPEQKSYQKVVEYVNQGIQNRKLKPGDRLPAERELAEQLETPGSKYSSTSGLSPRGHLERQAEFHASTQDEA